MDDSPSVSHGTKRKAEELPHEPKRIKALDANVVNKIAAGEIIVGPVNALKELIENAVDAGSTSLDILVKEGGLKLLQITDNGHGINKDDLPILCERHTTSKLKQFEDLQAIDTYGFRGEALASISHIAHLQITTRTADSNTAWKAHYSACKLVPPKAGASAQPSPSHGRIGTQITVEDMFYNVPNRRRAFRSATEEYAKILDMVGRYAVHCSRVSFSCKKHGEASMGLSVTADTSVIDRIRHVHGTSVANELLRYKCSSDSLGYQAEGYISTANYYAKKTSLLLFINHRAVESSAIKKAVEASYATFLPKGGHPFVYLSLMIEPNRVDVNVHPTKREVNFLNEDDIIEELCSEISASLGKVDTSRTFMTQTVLPGAKIPTISLASPNTSPSKTPRGSRGSEPFVATPRLESARSKTQKPYENNLVRVDSKARKITSMLPKLSSVPSREQQMDQSLSLASEEATQDSEFEVIDKEQVLVKLSSVKELRANVRDAFHHGLTEVFTAHTYVGIVDARRRIVAVQSGLRLLLIDYGYICNELFYQLALTDFANFGELRLDPPLDLMELLQSAADTELSRPSGSTGLDPTAIAEKVYQQLTASREMLSEYFSINITEAGQLESIPLLLKGYAPSFAKLPSFLLRLGPNVDWTDEKNCFRSFCRELAAWHVPEALPPLDPSAEVLDAEIDRRQQLERSLEHVIFPTIKSRLIATKDMNGAVVEVADLKGLYRVFERC